jgi:SAM-dependent methyltransferase
MVFELPDEQFSEYIAEFYDHVPAYANRSDIEFYVDHYREVGDSIVEVGCGSGRIMIPGARAGCVITGVDLSEPMLDQCRKNLMKEPESVRKNVTLVRTDMRKLDLGRRFRLATMPFRVFQHLISVDDQMAALQCIRDHLEAGGRLIFDIFHPDLGRLAGNGPDQEIEDTPAFDMGDGRRLRRTYRVTGRYPAKQYSDVELIYYVTDLNGVTARHVQAFPMRYLFRYEVLHLLERAGFRVAALYGNFDKSPLSDDSPEMIFVADKV